MLCARTVHEDSIKTAGAIAEEVRKGLRALVRRGSATASDLVFEMPESLHAITQLGVGPKSGSPLEAQFETALIQAIDELPPTDADAARIMFGVNPEFRSTRLGKRREMAAETLGVVAGTFRNRHEGRLLDALSQRIALTLLEGPPAGESHEEDASSRDPMQVLMIHGRESFGVKEVARLVEGLGLQPLFWQEALDRTGVWSPSVIGRFRSCLDVAQGVIVILEGGLGDSGLNLAFEAGLALGLAEERTVVVQLGDQPPPNDLEAVNILRLRSTKESVNALSAALRGAGCAVGGLRPASSKEAPKGIDVGWFHWTPTHAESLVYADVAEAVREFQPVSNAAGTAAAAWLKEEALEQFPGISTYLLLGEGRVEGFVSLQAGSLSWMDKSGKAEPESEFPAGAVYIRWIAKHRDAPGIEGKLLTFATSLAREVGEKVGSVAVVLNLYTESEAVIWEKKFPLLRSSSQNHCLWMPLHMSTSPEEREGGLLLPSLSSRR